MAKISRTSSIEKRRIHTSFVHRNKTIIDRASAVGPVTPVNPVFNNINYSSANHLMYSDALYDNLIELKNEYLNFYHHERNLQQAIKELEENGQFPIDNMNNLIDKYNMAIKALTSFDIHLRTNFTEGIQDIIQEHEEDLNRICISIVREKELEINERKFKDNLIESKDNIKNLLDPIRDMIVKLYREFRNIKGPYKEGLEDQYQDISYQDLSYIDSCGMILDRKS